MLMCLPQSLVHYHSTPLHFNAILPAISFESKLSGTVSPPFGWNTSCNQKRMLIFDRSRGINNAYVWYLFNRKRVRGELPYHFLHRRPISKAVRNGCLQVSGQHKRMGEFRAIKTDIYYISVSVSPLAGRIRLITWNRMQRLQRCLGEQYVTDGNLVQLPSTGRVIGRTLTRDKKKTDFAAQPRQKARLAVVSTTKLKAKQQAIWRARIKRSVRIWSKLTTCYNIASQPRIGSRTCIHTYHPVPYRTAPYHTRPHHTTPHHTIPYHTIEHSITLPYSLHDMTQQNQFQKLMS